MRKETVVAIFFWLVEKMNMQQISSTLVNMGHLAWNWKQLIYMLYLYLPPVEGYCENIQGAV